MEKIIPRGGTARPADERSDEEIARRMERGLRRALNTPAQSHGSNIDETTKRRKRSQASRANAPRL
jgi:hypothetical protein